VHICTALAFRQIFLHGKKFSVSNLCRKMFCGRTGGTPISARGRGVLYQWVTTSSYILKNPSPCFFPKKYISLQCYR
jgi:hypothetical protein